MTWHAMAVGCYECGDHTDSVYLGAYSTQDEAFRVAQEQCDANERDFRAGNWKPTLYPVVHESLTAK